MDTNFRRLEPLLILLIFTAVFAYIYPDLFFLIKSPMGGDPMTLKDPTVSWSAFMPAFREFRYELLEHGNLLWSNLRGMGQPLLGNAVQGAPLFPLNLVLLPLPDQLYWTVMPISRIVLISLAAYLIAHRVIGLSFAASLLFALLIGFNTNTLRWMNHPWSNGLLAGLWYFYFLCQICVAITARDKTWLSAGLITSVFAMVTSGFPEATIMSAMIVGILFFGFVSTNWSILKPSLRHVIALLIVCHIIGFALSAIQVFALLEYISESRAMELRSAFGSGSYEAKRLLAYTLAQVSFFGESKEQHSLLTFSMGLWGLFFAIRGLIALLTGTAKPNDEKPYTGFAIAFLVCMIVFVAKAFGLSDLLNKIFISTPILAQSHFPLYFSPLFFIGFAFFSALGFSELLNKGPYSAQQNLISILSSLIAIGVVVTMSAMALEHFHQMTLRQVAAALLVDNKLLSLRIFIYVSVFITALQIAKVAIALKPFAVPTPIIFLLGAIILALNVLEKYNTVPKQFTPIGLSQIGPSNTTKMAIDQAYAAAPLPQHELRGNDIFGKFVGQGLATIDNGVSAMLPPQLRLFRLSLFNVAYGGYFPLEKPKSGWSYGAMSANLYTLHATPRSKPSWLGYHVEEEIETELTAWPTKTQTLKNPFYLQGRSLAHVKEFRGVSIWLHFQSKNASKSIQDTPDDFWIEANIASQQEIGMHNERHIIDTPWRIQVPADWLASDSYDVTLRQIDPATLGFHDAKTVSLNVDRNHPDAIDGKRLQLLSSSQDNMQHFFFDKSALPRAFIASACHQAKTIEDEMNFYRRDNSVIKGEVVFPFNDKQTLVPCSTYQNRFKRVAINEDKRTELRFEPIQGPALLFLSDSDYVGWRAYDLQTGKNAKTELTIQRANSNGRSVFLPNARLYEVSMAYEPTWMKWVIALIALAIALMGLLYNIVWRNRKT